MGIRLSSVPLGAAVMPPGALPLARAIEGSAALARLGLRVQQSQQRLEAVRAALPAALLGQIRPGPCDDRQWVLLAAGAAAAAKLRQCLPDLHERLAAAGWPAVEVRVRVCSPEPAPALQAAPRARRQPE